MICQRASLLCAEVWYLSATFQRWVVRSWRPETMSGSSRTERRPRSSVTAPKRRGSWRATVDNGPESSATVRASPPRQVI